MSGIAQLVEVLLFIGVAAGLAWFAYHVILKKILRARHLRQLEMDRLVREAAARDPRPETHD